LLPKNKIVLKTAILSSGMPIAGKSEFVKLVEKYKCIYPFTHALLDGDGYVLTMKEEVTLNYLAFIRALLIAFIVVVNSVSI